MSYTNGLDDPSAYFQTAIYTGNTTAPRTISGVGFQPDWNWTKSRNSTLNHWIADSVRGSNKIIRADTTSVELTNPSSGYISSFNSDGYVITEGSSTDDNYNTNTTTYVSWNWKKSATAGFDIVSYTGTGSSNAVSHSLSATPSMIIIKNRDDTDSWYVWHQALGAVASNYINLDTNGAKSSVSDGITAISSSNFTVNTRGDVNASSEKYIAYCFSEVKGFSKFGSYTGNGNADGTFVYTGFKPAWVMIKRTDSTNNWGIMDNKRSTFNEVGDQLMANTSDAEDNPTSGRDFLSNGFKLRETGNAINGSGASYIYMAFAENPFVTSTGVPATAR